MSLTIRTVFGCTEAVIDEDGGLKRFYEVAHLLSDHPQIRFAAKIDDFDSIFWDFAYRSVGLTLHYNIYTGISLYPQNCLQAHAPENEAVLELADFLETELLVNAGRRFIV